mgnify:CR=1 FL=1
MNRIKVGTKGLYKDVEHVVLGYYRNGDGTTAWDSMLIKGPHGYHKGSGDSSDENGNLIEVKTDMNDLYYISPDEFKVVENTPKFKVGDIVNLTGNGKQHCAPHTDTWGGIQSDASHREIKIIGIYQRGADNTVWYQFNERGNWQSEEALELVKSEKSTNMKYKVKKWYPGCEGQEGEVIETSKDYSTPAYAEFYEVVKADTLHDLLKNCKFKVGEVLPTLLLKRGSTYSTNGQRTDTLDANTGFQASTILEFVLINNKAYFKTSRINTSDQFYFEISILESIERKRYVNWNLSEDGNSVMIGCQKYTKEDCLSFLNTLARAGQESIIFNYNSTEVPVSYTDIMYVYTLLKDN